MSDDDDYPTSDLLPEEDTSQPVQQPPPVEPDLDIVGLEFKGSKPIDKTNTIDLSRPSHSHPHPRRER